MIDDDEDDERAAELAQDERDFIRAENDRRRARAGLRSGGSEGAGDVFAVDIDIPIRSPLNGSHSGHAAVSGRRRRERQTVADAFAMYEVPPWPRYFVALERIGANRMDGDNFQAGAKSVRDQVAVWLGLDDADARIVWSYAQRIAREPDPRRPRFKSWARVIVARTAELVAAELAGAEVAPPTGEGPRSMVHQRGRPVVPEVAGGDEIARVELPRRPGKSTRLELSLRRLSKVSGRGTSLPVGSRYVRLATFWEDATGAWRSRGVAIHEPEIDELIAALQELRAAVH